MLYMVHLHYRPDCADRLRDHFERRGVSGHGVGASLLGAWVTRDRHAYALLELKPETPIATVVDEWATFGKVTYESVIDINQIM